MVRGPPAEGLRDQAHSRSLSPRRPGSGPGRCRTKAAAPRGPARLARRPAPPRAPARAASPGRGWKGRAQPLRAAGPSPAGRPSRPAPTCGARDLPAPPAARPRRPTLTAPAPRLPAKALAGSPLLRLAAARASGGRASEERGHSGERAEEPANRQREGRAAQWGGATAATWAGPVARLAELTAVVRAGRSEGCGRGERWERARGLTGARERGSAEHAGSGSVLHLLANDNGGTERTGVQFAVFTAPCQKGRKTAGGADARLHPNTREADRRI